MGLRPFVRYYWTMRVQEAGIVTQRTLPTGCVSLFFHRGERLLTSNLDSLHPRSFICGQQTVFTDVCSTGNLEMIVVVFQPHTAKLFFKHPISLFHNINISVDEIEDKELTDLANRIEDTDNHTECISLIENYLYQKITAETSFHIYRLSKVIQQINSTPLILSKKLSDIACLSEKQFFRVFSDNVGISPKDFIRIIRLQRALYSLQNSPETNWAQLAYECGFTDQSHMIKEFKQHFGCTPKVFIKSWPPMSDYFSF